MGYYADCRGTLYVDESNFHELVDTIENMIDEYEFPFDGYFTSETDGAKVVHVYDDQKYCESKVKSFLKKIEPWIMYGSDIEYVGEDLAMWRFEFRNEAWYEDYGYVAYNMSKNPITIGG